MRRTKQCINGFKHNFEKYDCGQCALREPETPPGISYYKLTLAFELSKVAYSTSIVRTACLGRSNIVFGQVQFPSVCNAVSEAGLLTNASTMESDPMVQGVDHHHSRISPLDAVGPYLPQWLQPFFGLIQPHIDAVLRLAVAILDDIAQQLAPLLHQAVAAASPYLQVSRCNPRSRGTEAPQTSQAITAVLCQLQASPGPALGTRQQTAITDTTDACLATCWPLFSCSRLQSAPMFSLATWSPGRWHFSQQGQHCWQLQQCRCAWSPPQTAPPP